MTEYLIAANEEWVPDYSDERMQEMSQAVKALRAEMKAAGVYVFLGGLDDSAPVFSVDATSGSPVFTDGPTSRPRSTSEDSRSLTCPTRRRLAGGPQRLPQPACGPTRCAVSKPHGSPPKARWDLLARRPTGGPPFARSCCPCAVIPPTPATRSPTSGTCCASTGFRRTSTPCWPHGANAGVAHPARRWSWPGPPTSGRWLTWPLSRSAGWTCCLIASAPSVRPER